MTKRKLSQVLLEYHDTKESAIYQLAKAWSTKREASADLIHGAMQELQCIENRQVPSPEFITTEMVIEIRRLRLSLLELLP